MKINTVAIGIKRIQNRIAIQRRRAEQFGQTKDRAIAITIKHQHAISNQNLDRALGNAVTIEIKG